MPITKYSSIVTIEYPNGNQVTRSITPFGGQMLNKYSLNDPRLAAFGYYNRTEDVIALPIPQGEVGDSFTWHLFFSGESGGEPLPPVDLRIDVRANEYYLAMSSTSPLFGSKGVGIAKNYDTMYFAWARDRANYPDQIDFMWGPVRQWVNLNGVMQTLPCLEGSYNNYDTAYYNAMSIITNGYPYGPITDPTRYESKPTDPSEATMDDDSDPIEIDNLPSAVAAGGLFRVYELTRQQMTTVSNTLASSTIYDTLVKMVTSPLDYFIKLQAMPVDFPSFAEDLRFGNYTITGLGSHILSNFITDVDCGQVSLPLYFSSFLDYAPATSVTLYLPFIGYVPLNVDLFVNDVIKLKYRVDAVSGDCVAFVSNSQGLVTTFSGNCAYNLPLRANDMSQVVAGLYSTVSGIATGQAQTAINGVGDAMSGVMKPAMISAGGLSSNSGSMTNRKPYVVIERPVPAVPKTYGETVGFASRISAKLSTLKGYTRIEEIHLDHVNATREEKAELERLLKEGVIL